MEYSCIVLSGLSGSGKTTLGLAYAKKWDYTFIDGDSFFKKEKPKVVLSNNILASNWDDEEAIDWDVLNKSVREQLKHNHVVLATFMPRIDLFTFRVFKHIRLSMGYDEEEKCILARRKSKHLNTREKIMRDELMVREYVYPKYLKMLKYPTDGVIEVFDGDRRKSVERLVEILDKYL